MNPDQKYLAMTGSQETIQTWASSAHINPGLREELLQSTLLLIPSRGYIDRPDMLYFPSGTEDLFNFLRGHQHDGLRVDICVEDNEYQELALHTELLILAGTIVSSIFVGVVVELMADYVKRRLGSHERDTNIKWDLTIQDDQTGKSVKLSYHGPASEYHDIMSKAIQNLNKSKQQLIMPIDQPKQIEQSKQLLPPRNTRQKRKRR